MGLRHVARIPDMLLERKTGLEDYVASSGARTPILVGLMLAMGLTAMDGTIVATAIPTIVHDLGGFSLFPWVFSLYLLAQAVTVPVYGKLADLYGRKPVLLFGAGLFLVGSALSGLSWGMVPLIVFRGLQGLGAGAIQPVATTVVGDLYSVAERARIQGYVSSVWGISAVVGPAIGGLLVQYASWHWIFYINLPLGALAIWVVETRLHERLERRRHRIDYAGSTLLLGGMVLVILDLLEGGVAWPWVSLPSVGVLGSGLLLLAAFTVVEARAAEPILPLWVFGRRFLAGANLGSLVVGLLSIGLSSFLPTFVQGVQGATPLVAGFALAAMSIGWPLASSQAGRLYLKAGFQRTALVGAGTTVLAALLFTRLGLSSVPWQAAVSSLVMGAGLGLMSTSLLVAVQASVEWGRRGVVTGANMFARNLGSSVGAAIYGAVLNGRLQARLAAAPPTVRQHLPPGLNAATLSLGGPTTVAPVAKSFVRGALQVSIHDVFVGLLLAALVGVLLVALMPSRFRPVEETA
jgi:EmrB/QacA subfamily drug resistance transporter